MNQPAPKPPEDMSPRMVALLVETKALIAKIRKTVLAQPEGAKAGSSGKR